MSPNTNGGDVRAEFLNDKASKDHCSPVVKEDLDMFVIIKLICYFLIGIMILILLNKHLELLPKIQLRTCYNSLLCYSYQKILKKYQMTRH